MKTSETTLYPYLIIMGVVVSWHVVWWMLLKTDPFPDQTQNARPMVRYLSTEGNRDNLWGPILFSLPSQSGFSSSLIKSREPSEPPLQFNKSLEVLAERLSEEAAMPLGIPLESMGVQDEAIQTVSRIHYRKVPEDPYTGDEAQTKALTITYADGNRLDGLRAEALFDNTMRPAVSGELLVDADINQQLWPESIRILNASGTPQWDQHVVRQLYQTRIPLPPDDRAVFSRQVRLRICWGGDA